ncbi:hypothetical protein GHK92_15135 [Nocardioides sp. dk4132]|uniref:hypothetical protein n=1 Tax=unclassified Nocardioides TaxID=2615069 RepID=UPI0012976D61|nr:MULTISPECIES: hypothetical protein [unclassified Nocardioides]MQW77206.1 hypothetical protein [Nocardioides sp. dk4132]QGA07971.1 hypothetical protein GFH29_11615 [Nocardioides sp. dk884]
MRFPTTAVAWLCWAVATYLAVQSYAGWWVPASLLACVAATWWLVGAERRGTGALVVGACLVLVALWFVLGVLLDRGVPGGDVLWVLPSWTPETGGSFGGAVTTGRLVAALREALIGAALLAVLGLLQRAVPAAEWQRLLDLVAGRGAAVLAPVVFLGEACAARRADRIALRAHGLDLPAAGVADLCDRARDAARAWTSTSGTRVEPAWHAGVRVVGAALLACAVLAAAVVPGDRTGAELGALALIVALLGGAVLARTGLPRLSGPALAPAVAALGLLLAVYAVPGRDPVVVAAAVLVLPAVALPTRRSA